MQRKDSFFRESCGSATVMIGILMFAFVGLLAFVIDLAHVKTVKTEVSNAADAAALRGARAFLPDTVPSTGPHELEPDPDRARTEAYNAIANNRSDNVAFQAGDVPLADIKVGIWDFAARTWLYGGAWQWPPDQADWGKFIGPAVSLPARRNSQVSQGPVSMTLARLFRINTVDVSANATAALMGVGGVREGGCPDFPICINKDLVASHQGQILFHSDNDDTGGWTNLRPMSENDHTDANDIKSYFQGTRECGNLPQDEEISVNNGTMCSATRVLIEERGLHFSPPLNLVQVPGTKNTWVPGNIIDPATYPDEPIYVFPVCTQDKFNQWHMAGATCAKILQVGSAPDDCSLKVQLIENCNAYLPGSFGGGPWYGVKSAEPKLVQ